MDNLAVWIVILDSLLIGVCIGALLKQDHSDAGAYNTMQEAADRLEAAEKLIEQLVDALEELHYSSSSHAADEKYYEALAAAKAFRDGGV